MNKQEFDNHWLKYIPDNMQELYKDELSFVITEAIAEHEAAQWKKIEADAYEKSIGWKLNYDFLKTLAENAANASGEQVQMEVVEAVLIAFRELPAPFKGKEESYE